MLFHWACRAARQEADQLKGRIAHAEARIGELQCANADLRAQLGLAPEPDQAGAPALPWKDETAAAATQDAGDEGRAHALLSSSSSVTEAVRAGGVVIEEVEPEVPSTPQQTEPHEEEAHEAAAAPDMPRLRLAPQSIMEQETHLTDID